MDVCCLQSTRVPYDGLRTLENQRVSSQEEENIRVCKAADRWLLMYEIDMTVVWNAVRWVVLVPHLSRIPVRGGTTTTATTVYHFWGSGNTSKWEYGVDLSPRTFPRKDGLSL